MRASVAILSLVLLVTSQGAAQVTIPGADGSDGVFNPTSNVKVRLDLAPTGGWNTTNASPGLGVYDPNQWAIVFRYSEVNIPAGVTVTFENHPANPPVVWLVDGPVTINGGVAMTPPDSTNGQRDPLNFGIPGPGGFRGSGTNGGTGGLGPGGRSPGQPAQYSSEAGYGNARCLPLIGGSGGGRSQFNGGGGAGAILIAGSGVIAVNGQVDANVGPGNFYCTGGAVRLICDELTGSGYLEALGYNGDNGRIRVEANTVAFGSVGNPPASFGLPGLVAEIWPEPATDPSVEVLEIGSVPVPVDPRALFAFPFADVNLTSGVSQTLVIEARNIPTGIDPPGADAWIVVARIVPRGIAPFSVPATYVSGDYNASIWHADITLPNGFAAIQVRASMPDPAP